MGAAGSVVLGGGCAGGSLGGAGSPTCCPGGRSAHISEEWSTERLGGKDPTPSNSSPRCSGRGAIQKFEMIQVKQRGMERERGERKREMGKARTHLGNASH